MSKLYLRPLHSRNILQIEAFDRWGGEMLLCEAMIFLSFLKIVPLLFSIGDGEQVVKRIGMSNL